MSTEKVQKSVKKGRSHHREVPEERRRLLVDAAIRSAAKYGSQGLSVRFIAREAGVTQGLITYHFGEVEELIYYTYDVLMDRFLDNVLTAINSVEGASAKLDALITVCTSPIEYKTDALATSIVFWGLILHSPRMRLKFKRQNEKHIELTENLLRNLAAEEGFVEGDYRLCAVSLFAMLDGLWLTWGLNPESFTAEEAREQGRKWVKGFRAGAYR